MPILKTSIEEHENLIEQAANALKQATENSSKWNRIFEWQG